MATRAATLLWRWPLEALRLLKRTVGFAEPMREPTYVEIVLEQLQTWTSELSLFFTMLLVGTTWLLVKLGKNPPNW